MANALLAEKVFGYAYEGEDLENTPLAPIANAIGLKPFGWYTKEALTDLYQTWVENIEGIIKGSPNRY